MKRTHLFLLSFTFVLASCASTGDGSSSAGSSGGDDGSMQIIGAVFSALLGMAAAESSGSAAQGQSVMQQSMSAFNSLTSSGSSTGADVQDAYANASSSGGNDTSGGGGGQAEPAALSGEQLESSFNPDRYSKGGSASGGACADNLSYLADHMPITNQPMVDDVRAQVLGTTMQDIMAGIKREGISIDTAIQQSLLQAQANDQSAKDAFATASEVDAYGTSDEQFEAALKSGQLKLDPCDSGIRGPALCAAVTIKYGSIMSRAVAANLMCYKRTGKVSA